MPDISPAIILQLANSLGLGLLIGLERGWRTRVVQPGTRIAGFRTFGVLGLAGGVAGLLPVSVAAASILAAAGLLTVGYFRQSARPEGMSATSGIVGLVTMLLGMASTAGFATEAIAGAAMLALVLSMRETFHGWLSDFSAEEIRSAIRFAIIALVILPLAPNRQMGPIDAWNPHKLWLVVVIVSGLSFIGYIASRRVRPTQGLLLTAICGAIVSSTAVTAAFARRLRTGDGDVATLSAGIAAASAVMFGRVLLLIAVLAPRVLPTLALIIGPAFLVALSGAWIAWRRSEVVSPTGTLAIGNPLELGMALALAGLVATISLASAWSLRQFGHVGLATILLLTGLADVDAAISAFTNLPAATLDNWTAGVVLAGPVLLNTILKAAITIASAPSLRGVKAACPLALSALAGGLIVTALITT